MSPSPKPDLRKMRTFALSAAHGCDRDDDTHPFHQRPIIPARFRSAGKYFRFPRWDDVPTSRTLVGFA
jgi:hypothetical protein